MSRAQSNQDKLALSLPVLTWLVFLDMTAAAFLDCPRKLDCTLRLRQPCSPGSHDCGPCLPHYQEDRNGRCTLRKFQKYGGKYKATGPDDVIDLIQSMWTARRKTVQSAGTEYAADDRYVPTTRPDTGPHLPITSRPLGTAKHLESTSTTISMIPATTESTTANTEINYHSLPSNERRNGSPESLNETVSLTLVIICAITGVSGLLVAALCWYRLQKEVRLAQKIAYTAYRGSQHPAATKPADTRLAKSLEVHHYQTQKRKILAMEEGVPKPEKQMSTDSETDNGDYTVYECPGLAPTGEMEIHNPLFDSSVLHGTSCTAPK